jgi:hypothetical protein
VRRLAGVVIAGAALLVMTPRPAAAAQPAPSNCEVRVAGKPFQTGSRISVPAKRRATISVTALEERPRYHVQLELAGVRSTVGTGTGRDFGWRRELDIPKYADFGVGTYRLRVTTFVDGKPCIAIGRISIKGRAPLTTAAGTASAIAAVFGSIGLIAILSRRGGRPLHTRHPFGVEDPLGQFVAVHTPGNYVGWAEVTCDLGSRAFVTTKPSGDSVRAFLSDPNTHARLEEVRARGVRVKAGDREHVLPRIRWRPRVFVVGPLIGMLTALGIVVYLQQASVIYLRVPIPLIAAGIGLGVGLVIANLARLLGAFGLNRRLASAELGLEEEFVEPRYPPIDHLDKLDTYVWTPTHTIPETGDGQPAWEHADRTVDSVATLDPGLPVRVVEQRDGLAQIVCSNGWVGWTDAEPLEQIEA